MVNAEQEITGYCSSQPHEFSSAPRSIKYYVKGPVRGPDEKTGILLVIHGQAEHPNMHYYRDIRKEWADRYNVYCIGVEYLGTKIYSNPPGIPEEQLRILDRKIQPFYTPAEIRAAQKDGVIQYDLLPPKNLFDKIIIEGLRFDEPVDCGYIQTIDCLAALQHVLAVLEADKLPCCRNRIAACGVSHGGYLAQMCAKFAPDTFAGIGDLGGYCFIMPELIAGGNIRVNVGKVRITVHCENFYSDNPDAPGYYNEARFSVRDLSCEEHVRQIGDRNPDMAVVMLHGSQDEIMPAGYKIGYFHKLIRFGVHAKFHLFYPEDCDGNLVTAPDHNLGDRKGLMERYFLPYLDVNGGYPITTKTRDNFIMKDEIVLPVNTGAYRIKYDGEYPTIRFTATDARVK